MSPDNAMDSQATVGVSIKMVKNYQELGGGVDKEMLYAVVRYSLNVRPRFRQLKDYQMLSSLNVRQMVIMSPDNAMDSQATVGVSIKMVKNYQELGGGVDKEMLYAVVLRYSLNVRPRFRQLKDYQMLSSLNVRQMVIMSPDNAMDSQATVGVSIKMVKNYQELGGGVDKEMLYAVVLRYSLNVRPRFRQLKDYQMLSSLNVRQMVIMSPDNAMDSQATVGVSIKMVKNYQELGGGVDKEMLYAVVLRYSLIVRPRFRQLKDYQMLSSLNVRQMVIMSPDNAMDSQATVGVSIKMVKNYQELGGGVDKEMLYAVVLRYSLIVRPRFRQLKDYQMLSSLNVRQMVIMSPDNAMDSQATVGVSIKMVKNYQELGGGVDKEMLYAVVLRKSLYIQKPPKLPTSPLFLNVIKITWISTYRWMQKMATNVSYIRRRRVLS
ncbi:uncharacterized protein [Amphiura filiformis]|uniref:uncharacterized protein isoform X1 n=1 Tax=Amphiura filiformis TaxID=82378 RepID=UPI003B218E89